MRHIPAAVNQLSKAWPPGNVNIEPLGHVPVDVYNPLSTSGNIAGESYGSSTIGQHEVPKNFFAVVFILNDITLLVCTSDVNNLLTYLYAPYFSLHLFCRHMQTVKEFSQPSVR